jgi:DNA-binding transcriptional ArsR family regulator
VWNVIQAIALVLDHAPDHWNTGTRMVALALADRVGDEYVCWPSIEDLARRTGLKPRMVKYHLRYLEEEGVIARQERRRGNGSQQSNLWVWLWKLELNHHHRVQHIAPPVVQHIAPWS